MGIFSSKMAKLTTLKYNKHNTRLSEYPII